MLQSFEVATGTVQGTEHRAAGRNNQDAFAVRRTAHSLAVVVCDGCSAGSRSEVGAHLGAALVTEALAGERDMPWPGCEDGEPLDAGAAAAVLEQVRVELLGALAALAGRMGPSLPAVADQHLLFTVVGAWLSPGGCVLFSAGDGIVALNGEITRLGPFAGNEPPYLSYGLVPITASATPQGPRFTVHAVRPLAEVHSLLVGTDGAVDLVRVAAQELGPTPEPVGPLAQFWEDDRYFGNPDAVRRRLALANRPLARGEQRSSGLGRASGLLPDDTTIAVVRRRHEER